MTVLDDWLRKSWRNRLLFWWERLRLRVDYWLHPADISEFEQANEFLNDRLNELHGEVAKLRYALMGTLPYLPDQSYILETVADVLGINEDRGGHSGGEGHNR